MWFFLNFASKMEKVQFAAVMLMALLTVKLLMLPVRSIWLFSRARWLLACSTALLGIQFLLQYTLQLRTTGHLSQAIMLNIAIFIPCSIMFSLTLLYLLRRGHMSKLDKYIGVPVWIGAMVMVGLGLSENDPISLDMAKIVAAILYAGMQVYYLVRHLHFLNGLRKIMENYYDRDNDNALNWMRVSVVFLAMMAAMVPFVIFTNGWWLPVFALLMFVGIFYLVDSFCLYVVSAAAMNVMEAEQHAEMEEAEAVNVRKASNQEHIVDTEAMHRVNLAVDKWIEHGGYLKSGQKLPTVAEEIGLPQYLLSNWLRMKDLKYSEWMTNLRIEEAKRVIREHPEWSNETVAQHCGFADRSYFQKKFKEKTGITPAEFISVG